MSLKPVRFAALWLATLCLVAQTLYAGIPAGAWLCIGCDGGPSLTGAACPEFAPTSVDCCDDAATAERGEAPAGCGCVDVPLPDEPIAPAQWRESMSSAMQWRALALDMVQPIVCAEAVRAAPAPWAGPPPLVRLGEPLARRTVLTL